MRHPGSLILAGLIALTAALTFSPAPAHAAFHLWQIKEVYSNADGTVQYIELFTSSGSQGVLGNHTITATSDGVVRTFTFPAGIAGNTASKHLLIATPGFSRISTATPDYTLPCGPFFTPGATSITINFGEGTSTITINGPGTLPTNGINSMTVTPLGSQNLVSGTASPVNFAGTAGTVPTATSNACNDSLFCNGAESCSGSACVATGACTEICDEVADTCVECNSPADCNDNNVCTTEACTGNACVITNNTLPCNDGLFCTATDTCGGGTCTGAGDACAGQNCLEGPDSCGVCTVAADCDDGVFCNGAETCLNATSCQPAAAGPCTADVELCDEVADECDRLCGNGAIDGTEACDDGNAVAGDGCATGCTVEDGWTCDDAEPTACTEDPEPPDAGVPDVDAGTEPPPAEDDGCCSTGAPRTGSALLSLLVLGLALRRRRLSGRCAGA